jgi:flagellar hook-length control protein FliK
MTIQMDGDVVMARITVENQQVKQIIESNLQALRDSLEEQNLQAGAFDVNVNQGSQNEERESLASGRDVRGVNNTDELGNEPSADHLTAGTETGRRFGSNTIEYFA